MGTVLLDRVQIFVRAKAAGVRFDQRNGNVGTVVGHALVIGQQIGKDEAHLDGAGTRLQAFDVRGLCLGDQQVDDLLQRLDTARHLQIFLTEGVDRQVQA